MTQAILQKTQTLLSYRERVFAVLALFLALSAIWYGFALHGAIMNVVSREDVLKQIQLKSSSVATLESEYFNLKNGVSLETAHKDGFKEVPVSMFISKKSFSALLTQSNEL